MSEMHRTRHQASVIVHRYADQPLICELAEDVVTLYDQIGTPPPGSHPDEAAPRGATWHEERTNWQAEIDHLRNEIASLRSQLAALSAEREWRDIKTAPKDGTQIVAIGQLRTAPGRTRACITHWCKAGDAPLYVGEGWTYCAPGLVDLFDSTHWQPLPAPPAPGGETTGKE